MTSRIAEKNLPPAKNLKRSFECAVRDIYQVGLTGKASQYRTPIVQRRHIAFGVVCRGQAARAGGCRQGARPVVENLSTFQPVTVSVGSSRERQSVHLVVDLKAALND